MFGKAVENVNWILCQLVIFGHFLMFPGIQCRLIMLRKFTNSSFSSSGRAMILKGILLSLFMLWCTQKYTDPEFDEFPCPKVYMHFPWVRLQVLNLSLCCAVFPVAESHTCQTLLIRRNNKTVFLCVACIFGRSSKWISWHVCSSSKNL